MFTNSSDRPQTEQPNKRPQNDPFNEPSKQDPKDPYDGDEKKYFDRVAFWN